MKILILGNTGQLGTELARLLPRFGDLAALDYPDIDMADAGMIRSLLRKYTPDVIFNATAYTAVDKAESEIELAEAINGRGPGILAEEAKKRNALLFHYSTDFVFDGEKGKPYIETDLPNPLSIYGRSKLHGEQAVVAVDGDYLTFRTSWVYGLENESGFVKKVLGWSRQHNSLKIVDDQISNPTWARMLAEMTVKVLEKGVEFATERKGLYHLAGAGFASRYEWVKEILALDPNKSEQIATEILPVKSDAFPLPAQRPTFSALNCDLFQETFQIKIPEWQRSLEKAMR
ncbi:MAG: dTDP-4-dehydrorhamnose reductase [Chloroflexi bacterium]|nr:dTDP-4-dehydrorhamnose reductase [Chloroflexota bacterium]